MKNEYKIKSDRYNHMHSFIKDENSEYFYFKPEKDWMITRIIYDGNEHNKVRFIDSDGGPLIGKGFSTNEIIVEDIFIIDNKIKFKLKENV